MQPFVRVSGPAVALPMANVDTDVIMPKQFLKGIDRASLDRGALFGLRFDEAGRPRPEFALNQSGWRNPRFLVVGPNFGCGSSREHAVWGLMQLGFRGVLGTSFAGIFADNAAINGLLLISLPTETIAELLERAGETERNTLTVDLQELVIETESLRVPFTMEQTRRDAMLRGLDAIGATLEYASAIFAFQTAHFAAQPWLEGPR
jgi:3-isopropylmalate/(R)-2-methylmalate dehydratase small subunit